MTMKLLRLARNSHSISFYSTISLLSISTKLVATSSFSRSPSDHTYKAQFGQLVPLSSNRQMHHTYLDKDRDTFTTKILKDPIFLPGKARWGFVILRGTYGDDAAWEDAMSQIAAEIPFRMDILEKEQDIESLIEHTVLENPAAFTEAKKDSLRPFFTEWVNTDLASRIDTSVLHARYDIPPPFSPTDPDFVSGLLFSTRHAYFLYINKLCLDSFKTDRPVVVLVQHYYEAPGFPDFGDDWDPIESNPHFDVGWCYMTLRCYMERYNNLADAGDFPWESHYERPPWLSDWLLPIERPAFGPELNAEGTGPAGEGPQNHALLE